MSERLDTWLDGTSIQVTIQTTFASAYYVKVDRSRRERGEGGMLAKAEGGRLDSVLTGVDRIGRGVVETSHEERTELSSNVVPIQHPFKVEH